MAKNQDKIARTYRLDRSVIALLETYAKENKISNTEAVELAIKRLCRTGNQPATQDDVRHLAEAIQNTATADKVEALIATIEKNQIATLAAIANQPIAIAEQKSPEKRGFWRRLIGD